MTEQHDDEVAKASAEWAAHDVLRRVQEYHKALDAVHATFYLSMQTTMEADKASNAERRALVERWEHVQARREVWDKRLLFVTLIYLVFSLGWFAFELSVRSFEQ